MNIMIRFGYNLCRLALIKSVPMETEFHKMMNGVVAQGSRRTDSHVGGVLNSSSSSAIVF